MPGSPLSSEATLSNGLRKRCGPSCSVWLSIRPPNQISEKGRLLCAKPVAAQAGDSKGGHCAAPPKNAAAGAMSFSLPEGRENPTCGSSRVPTRGFKANSGGRLPSAAPSSPVAPCQSRISADRERQKDSDRHLSPRCRCRSHCRPSAHSATRQLPRRTISPR
jgi:hypothetical protein